MSAKRERKQREDVEMDHLLSTETSPQAQREWLARFLDISTLAVQPSLGLECHWIREIALVVRYSPRACVNFGLIVEFHGQ